jgi:hypothetical protein
MKLGLEPPSDDSLRPYVDTWVVAYRRTSGDPEG